MCGMEQWPIEPPGNIRSVRKARVENRALELKTRPPQGHTNPTCLTATLTAVGKDFPAHNQHGHKWFPVEVPSARRLHFLAFDHDRQRWYLSCGGVEYCRQCQAERDQTEDRELELGPMSLGRLLDSDLHFLYGGPDYEDWLADIRAAGQEDAHGPRYPRSGAYYGLQEDYFYRF